MPNINSLIKGLRSTQEYFDTISYANIAMIDLDVQVQFEKKVSVYVDKTEIHVSGFVCIKFLKYFEYIR